MNKFASGFVACLAIGVAGCATGGTKQYVTDDARSCANSLTYDGSFLMGRTFRARDLVSGVSKKAAVERIARHVASEGWEIGNIDRELGIISASQGVAYGGGKTVPLSFSIEEAQNGVSVAMTFTISGGTTTSVDSVKDGFCKAIEAVAASGS